MSYRVGICRLSAREVFYSSGFPCEKALAVTSGSACLSDLRMSENCIVTELLKVSSVGKIPREISVFKNVVLTVTVKPRLATPVKPG